MPKGTNQKLKLYYLSQILLEKTDEDHMITMPEIKTELAKYGVTADRKSLYDDLEALKVLGIEVKGEKAGHHHYNWSCAKSIPSSIWSPSSVRSETPERCSRFLNITSPMSFTMQLHTSTCP